jgi:hypothetical protein
VLEGMITLLEELEPSKAFDELSYITGLLLKTSWSLAENREFSSRYGLWAKKVMLLTCLSSPLHIALQSQ